MRLFGPALLAFVATAVAALAPPAGGQAPAPAKQGDKPLVKEKVLVKKGEPPTAEQKMAVAAADKLVEKYMKDHQVPGMVVGVVWYGRTLVEKGYGVRSLTDPQPPDPDTLFYIGSLSKALTGYGVEVLAGMDKLPAHRTTRMRLTDPIEKYVPDVPAAWKGIQLRHVLAHQSGIPDLAGVKGSTFAETLRAADPLPMPFVAGRGQRYNNFNYALAGKVIESASGQPYLDFMRDQVFKPLHMTRSGYGQVDANMATGHNLRKDGTVRPADDAVPKGGEYGIPSGFLQTTLADLLRLYRGIQMRRPVAEAQYREMITPVTPELSGTPGWFTRTSHDLPVIHKNGAAAGFTSEFYFVDGRGHAVILIMNLKGGEMKTAALVDDLFRDIITALPPPVRPKGKD